MGKLLTFPLKGTEIHKWYTDAMIIKKDINVASAQLWIKKNVPEQFQKMIDKNMRLTK